MPGRHQSRKRNRSVRAYVVRLVAAVALPLLVFGACLLVRSASHEQQAIATTVHERAQGAAADLNRELRHLQDVVSMLAAAPYVFVEDANTLNRYVSGLLTNGALGVVVRDPSGKTLLNTCTADDPPFPTSSQFDTILYTRNSAKPYIS